ncbi:MULTISPECIES: asparagine synthase-related protein [Streptomyces]|uniref:Asparagine synthase-related protein n=2 Tax=Streptomyces TaxID=1883 RepID=A0ABD5JF79_9ACTN|nr:MULTISPECIES: asparagine synthase-related protein [Streptomyces]MEE4586891.1 asparagine synthase-related protein [Streptomyces sp. DSM 41602]QTI89036.1 asparagine synthase [Streptomyces sp. AgN23]RSS38091.1 asparagine synthase [Streptomyces sp. WAC05858]WJD98157.1 asparagine synthase-related protein [Streptomyces antimycoticus]WTA83050.1 asparagine synthase-related protein [Streptomyces antimycoticus]
MRWLVGWSSTASGPVPPEGRAIQPVGAQLLWSDPDPLWAVGDWRPDEVRVVQTDPFTRLAVFGCCGATDEELRVGLFAARGGALRHLTAWSGSYTAVAQVGRRITIVGDLAGARPVFHTDWAGGTAYATAALPLADLIEAQLDVGHLGALLACPDSPEAMGDGTPYMGVRRVPPGHALILRDGARDVTGYEPTASLAVAAPPLDQGTAVDAVQDALVEAVRARLTAPRHAPETDDLDPGPVPGMGPAERRAARGAPAPGIGADLSGGSASATLALLAAGLPGMPGTLFGHGTEAGERLLAVTFNDLATAGGARTREAELERAGAIAANPRLHHVVVTAGEEALPYAGLDTGALTDEPGPSLVIAERHRRRLAAGSADHFIGHGARQVLDAHPARLADLLLDRRRRHLLRPATALAKADGPSAQSFFVPFTVYRAARRLARTSYRDGVQDAAVRLLERRFADDQAVRDPGAVSASLAALTWCRPGPAARWLTGETLAEVSVRLEEAAMRPVLMRRPGERRADAALARYAADHRVFEQAAEIRSQRLHAPFLDNQVVRACRALPEALRVQPGARAAVLRTVLAGAGIRELPPGWGATSHAAHTAAVRTGMRTWTGELMTLFDAPLLADAGLIEARVVRKALRAAAQGERLPLDGLAELVSTEVWLRRLLARRGTCWTGTAAPRQRAVAGGVVPRPSL